MATYNEISSKQLHALCTALGLQRSYPEYLLLQRLLFESWGEQEVPRHPIHRSLVGDDNSPYEYSVAFCGKNIELRLLLEAQAAQPSVLANHKAALQLTKRIASVFALNLSRLHTIADLLCPPDPQGLFTLWHGVSFRENEQPSFKVYLNPRVRGKSRANELVTQALERLGFHAAARMLGESLAWRAGNRDEISYLSLDLSDRPGARVKIYFAHHHVTAAELDRIFSAAPTHTIGEVTEFCLHMVGHAGPFNGKPVTSCFSFVDGSDQPLGVTLHLPISHYAESDDVIAERVESFLRKHGMNSNLYRPMIQRYSTQPTSLGTGIQSYASYRQDAAGMKLTTYLSPRLYQNPGLSNALQQVELPVAVSRAHSELLETRRREDERFRQRPIRPNDR